MKDKTRQRKEDKSISSFESFRQAKYLLEEYDFQVPASELKKVAKEADSDPKKMVALYLNIQIQNVTKGALGFEKGLMIDGDDEKVLSRAKGSENFFHQPKANRIWSVVYINFELAEDFNEAILRCEQLTKFFASNVKFVFDPVLSNRFDRGPFKIVECRRLFDAVPCYLIRNNDLNCIVEKRQKQTIGEVLQEAQQLWGKEKIFYIV